MNIGKICGMAVIVVVIVPLILGFVWPTGTETEDVWEAEPALDITSSLSNSEVRVYDTYTGPLNNLSIIHNDIVTYPNAQSTTNTPNAYGIASVTETQNVSTFTPNNYGAPSRITVSGLMTYSDGETYNFADYWPKTNVLTLWRLGIPYSFTPNISDVLTAAGNNLLQVDIYGAPSDYMDTKAGIRGATYTTYWANGFMNKSVTIWAKPGSTASFDVLGAVSLSKDNDGMVTATGNGESVVIGSAYDYFEIVVRNTGEVTVTGLLNVDNFIDTTYTKGNSTTFVYESDDEPFAMIGIRAAYANYWVKSAQASIAMTKGIKDSVINPYSYYGQHAWQVTFLNPSTFGESITVGNQVFAVEDGSITVTTTETVTDPETQQTTTVSTDHELAVRNLSILSLIVDGVQKIYVGGYEIISQTPQTTTITLDGEWYMSVVQSKVVQSQHEKYVWEVGHFGFDQAAFCLAGLLSCVGVAIAGSIWGRTNGEKMLVLHITMILCGVAYLVMM